MAPSDTFLSASNRCSTLMSGMLTAFAHLSQIDPISFGSDGYALFSAITSDAASFIFQYKLAAP